MKCLIGSALALISCTASFADNPIIQTNYTADPAPMVYKNTVYLYTSHDEDNAKGWAFNMKNWMCYTSTDMANWTDHGIIASLRDFKWADGAISGWGGFENGAWAPQCIERDGKFYMYCPVQGRGIGVLVAAGPFGPFTDPVGKPLINGKYDSIDPTVYIDDDGQAYLYWGNPHLWYVKLNKDMISFSGDPVMCATPAHYQEGPWFYKRTGHYYMAFASTCCPEGIGYAMSDSATGPWTYKGQIMDPNGASSGNHPGIIDYKGSSYVFGFDYAINNVTSTEHNERRSVCVDRFTYAADGTIPTIPFWSDAGASQIGVLKPYNKTPAATICWASIGLKTEHCNEGGVDVCHISNGNYIKVKGVDFGSGAKSFEARIASANSGCNTELHLDSPKGPLVGTCPVPSTGSSQTWATKSCKVSGATGVHDLYFVFTGEGDNLFTFSWWQFHKN